MSLLRQVPDLKGLIDKYGLKVYAETGCFQGDGLRTARELGLECYSCDINPESCAFCADLGFIFNEDSCVFLRRIIGLGEFPPTLWFLDAHFPKMYGMEGERWPLPNELRILSGKKGIERDVIICDDMQAIQDPDNWARQAGQGHDWEAVDGTIAELTAPFESTHLATLHAVSTGILIMVPK